MNKKPKHFLIFKILGIIGLIVAIFGIVLTFTGFGNFESNKFMLGGILTSFGFILGFVGLIIGFSPEIAKMNTKSIKYIQGENKEDLTDIANNTADITSGAVTKTARAVKEGLTETVFCKHCGAKIDNDSKFCSFCGKKQ